MGCSLLKGKLRQNVNWLTIIAIPLYIHLCYTAKPLCDVSAREGVVILHSSLAFLRTLPVSL